MLSLKDRLELLEKDISAKPPRVSVYGDLPFAILRYDPGEEWTVRREARLLATRLKATGREVHIISLAKLLWEIVEETEGLEAIAELEQQRGFEAAQEQITTYLSDADWMPLCDALLKRIQHLDHRRDVVFLMRAASMSPGIYHMSKLLDEMQGGTSVITILFYPGKLDGTTGLRFMDLKDREALGNYRVKIYG